MDSKKCKKCGCDMPSNSKKKLCESCRLRKKEKIKKGFLVAGGVALTALTVVAGKKLKDKN